MNIARVLAFFLIFMVFLQCLEGHQVATVELEFQQLDHQWRLSGEMDIAYMLPETRDIPGGPPLSREAIMKSAPEEFDRIRKETEATLRKLVRITFAGQNVAWRVEFPDFQKVPFALPPEAGDIALISVILIINPQPEVGELRAFWSGEQETELIVLSEDGDDAKIVSTLPGGNLMLLNQTALGKSIPVKKPVSIGWVLSGFHHVLPKGMDHMLFILGLFLLVPRWKPLMGQSLLFTLAHSITLALAVYGLVHVSSKWVEVLIAVSITCIGIENLLTHKLGKKRMILVFCFGLLHGLGFASVLAEKIGDVPRSQLATPLLGFNVGVELAQICVLLAAFLILWPLRKWTPQVQKWGSVCITLIGIIWVVQRLSAV